MLELFGPLLFGIYINPSSWYKTICSELIILLSKSNMYKPTWSPNFINKLQTRLINPSKTELGKISKNIIQNIVANVKEANYRNLWRNSYVTIEWLRKIKNKSKATFMQLDIIDFCPSISKNILIDSINYALKYIDITIEQYDIISACMWVWEFWCLCGGLRFLTNS